MAVELERYLKPTRFVESDAKEIEEKSAEIVVGAPDQVTKAGKLFYWARDNIRYNVYSKILLRDEHRATVTLERGDGNCMQKATFLCALMRAARIPARLGFADIRNHLIPKELRENMGTDLFVFHGFVEAYLNNRWVRLTPAFDIETCSQHGIVPCEFDGTNDAMLSPVDVHGQRHFEYVQFRGIYDDFPFEEMFKAAKAVYGSDVDYERFS